MKKLSRQEKRKISREQAKKNKKITPKECYLNRAQRRDLKNDKNLINNLFAIIFKYFPKLLDLFDNLTDVRNSSYIKYSMKAITVTRLFGLLCGIVTMAGITDDLYSEKTKKNLEVLLQQHLKDIPHHDTIQDVFEYMYIDELRDIQKYMVNALIRSKMFDKYRHEGKFIVAIDGTGLFSFDEKHCDKCLTRKTTKKSHGKTIETITYYHYVLEAKLIVGNIVISISSEFIENTPLSTNSTDTETKKQDCESKAFIRLADRIKTNFPNLSFIIVGDGLYANDTVMTICNNHNWDYILNLKKERLKNITEEFEDNINYENLTTHKNYYLSKNIFHKNHSLDVFRFIELKRVRNHKTKKYKNVATEFNYLTNLDVTHDNIKDMVSIGRSRWKIENCGFRMQKNGTFNIKHKCSMDENAMKAHYFFIQFAHTIRQLLEQGCSAVKNMKVKIKELSELLVKSLNSHSTEIFSINLNFQLRFPDLL